MKKLETPLEGLFVIELKIFNDARGFFVERYNKEKLAGVGLEGEFIQDNHSSSAPGVVRGLHYQHSPGQAKLVSCMRGSILDVAVDLRQSSKTFGEQFSIELTPSNGKVLYIPEGFGHGFSVIGDDPADVLYKVNSPYSPQTEGGILYSDPDLNIDWKVETALVSEKDGVLPTFKEYRKNPIF